MDVASTFDFGEKVGRDEKWQKGVREVGVVAEVMKTIR